MIKKKAYVIGTKTSSSLSPAIFKYWFKKYNIKGEYGFIEIKEKNFDKEIKLILKRDDLVGLNITIPYKEKIVPHLKNKLDKTAKEVGAVNYIYKNPKGHWVGCNSDSIGFSLTVKPFEKKTKNKKAIVLGYGGASKAIIFALASAGYQKVKVFNRTYKKIKNIKNIHKATIENHKLEELKDHAHDADIIINTIPINVLKKIKNLKLKPSTIGFDVVYNPKEGTGFLDGFKSKKRIRGIHMLAHQAVPCWNAWFAGPRAEVETGLIKTLFRKMAEHK